MRALEDLQERPGGIGPERRAERGRNGVQLHDIVLPDLDDDDAIVRDGMQGPWRRGEADVMRSTRLVLALPGCVHVLCEVLSIDYAQAFMAFLVLLLSLTVHEAAHAWTAERLGDPTARMLGRVSLNPAVHIDPIGTLLFPAVALFSGLPVIGWAKPVPVNLRNLPRARRDFLVVAAAGPASNLLLAGVGAVVWRLIAPSAIGPGWEPSPLLLFVLLLVNINVLLAVFNMLPVPPLDGGNVLAGVLPESAAQQFDRLRPYGFLLLYALLLTGAFRVLVWPVTDVITSWLL